MEIRNVLVGQLNPAAYNPRKDLRPGDTAYQKLERSMEKFGCVEPIVWNQRLKILIAQGAETADVSVVDLSPEDEKALNIALNKIAGEWDETALSALLEELGHSGADVALTGFDAGELDQLLGELTTPDNAAMTPTGAEPTASLTLKEKFLVPPFTVLDARSGFWLQRKQAWKALGLRSELGRGAEGDKSKPGLVLNRSAQPPAVYKAKNAYEAEIGRTVSWETFAELFPEKMAQGGTSVFDPVLCELVYRWFCPQGGAVLDPFAGGSVRGIVAALTGREYTGIDLSPRQIEANVQNWEQIAQSCYTADEQVTPPHWTVGDSADVDRLAPGEYDLMFTCPPYADLEVYSDRPEDLSNMEYPQFLAAYRQIFQKAAAMLKPNRFACVVVGDVRDKKGIYRGFVSDTITALCDAGLKYYNEAVLVTPYGSVVTRAGRFFTKSRKLGKTHQNVLIFVKGDPFQAASDIGTPECAEDLQTTDNASLLDALLGETAG